MLAWLTQLLVRRPPNGQALGRFGESLAAKHLKRSGFRLIGRNLTTSIGEADLVFTAPDRRTIVVVEVKTRALPVGRERAAPPPEASITRRKARKLVLVAMSLSRARGWGDRPVRIDVVGVDWSPDGRHAVRHHVNAVDGNAR